MQGLSTIMYNMGDKITSGNGYSDAKKVSLW